MCPESSSPTVNRCEVRCASGKGGGAMGRCGVPRGGNGEMRCASGRQRGDAVCLGEVTGRCGVGRQWVRCGVPRGGNKETRCASGR